MLKKGLEFAAGTSEDCQKLVVQLFKPEYLFGAYRMARSELQTGDIALVTAEWDPSGVEKWRRHDYVAKIRAGAAKMLPVLTIAHKSAHQIAALPFESDAFWLIILRKDALPIMCVIFMSPYEVAAEDEPLLLPTN